MAKRQLENIQYEYKTILRQTQKEDVQYCIDCFDQFAELVRVANQVNSLGLNVERFINCLNQLKEEVKSIQEFVFVLQSAPELTNCLKILDELTEV